METPESLVARNVAQIREARGLTVRALSARLDELGAKILPSGITKIENGTRGVSVADLVALAVALDVNPNRLLLPADADDQEVAVTPNRVTDASNAWNWADGRWPLHRGDEDTVRYFPEGARRQMDFVSSVRPLKKHAWEQHPAALAAAEVRQHLMELVRKLAYSPTPERKFEAVEAREDLSIALDRLSAEVASTDRAVSKWSGSDDLRNDAEVRKYRAEFMEFNEKNQAAIKEIASQVAKLPRPEVDDAGR